ncbi:hypothetical protein EFA69_01005 [Rufibacter immobilis]|uniref:Adhesin domain-containing protein n=1 Tax=Rufibacter immobilis TaxID=1348778 RepID=A0A3M9N5G5_9BACT|nr:hypothetical protein [Rufibacter immobilis]RNI33032.1 hypothetical protein EFA69_01005 [Rufibacter immobilis]
MKLPISKLLPVLCFCAAVGTAQAQTVHVPATPSCHDAITHVTKAEVAAHVEQALSSLKSLEVLENLREMKVVENLELLASPARAMQDLDLPELPVLPNLAQVMAQDLAQETTGEVYSKSRKVSRSFKVDRADKLNIENQFGRVDVQTWAKNEIAVEVTIVARAVTEAKAQEILDRININELRSGGLISFVTQWEPMQIRSSSEKGFEINYLVRMPKANPLRVSNKYGTVQLPDFDGPTELELKYAKLTTGSLNNTRNSITVAYSGGECRLAYVKGGNLNFKYSSMQLAAADDIRATTAYSNIGIDKVDVLSMESRYDARFHVGSASQVSGSGSYSNIKIGNLRESASLNVKYCSGFEISNVASGFRKVDLTGGYTGMALGFADNSAFNFEVDTHYGSLKMNQDLADFSFKEVRNTSSTYKGKYGKASPKGSVNVSSRYGSIAFN